VAAEVGERRFVCEESSHGETVAKQSLVEFSEISHRP
jgi:hypothetical protein